MELSNHQSLIAVLTLLATVNTFAAPIEVFTTTACPVSVPAGLAISVVNLDEPVNLEAELSAGLGTDPAKAQATINARINTPRGQQLIQAIPSAYSHSLRALTLGIERLPAVVFDGRYVIYGVTDINEAQRLFLQRVQTGAK